MRVMRILRKAPSHLGFFAAGLILGTATFSMMYLGSSLGYNSHVVGTFDAKSSTIANLRALAAKADSLRTAFGVGINTTGGAPDTVQSLASLFPTFENDQPAPQLEHPGGKHMGSSNAVPSPPPLQNITSAPVIRLLPPKPAPAPAIEQLPSKPAPAPATKQPPSKPAPPPAPSIQLQKPKPEPAPAPSIPLKPAPVLTAVKPAAVAPDKPLGPGDVPAKRVVSEEEMKTFSPKPAAPAKKAGPTDCWQNQPQGYDPGFMMLPVLSPLPPCDVLVNLMTTFVNSKDPSKIVAQENVLRSFQRLRPFGVRAWLFTESAEWSRKAREHGVEVVSHFRKNNANTPCLAYMYEYVAHNDGCSVPANRTVFDAYLNGDILLGQDMVETVRRIAKVWGPEINAGRRGVLAVGLRYNKAIGSKVLDSEESTVAFGKDAAPFQTNAQDYFLFSRGFVNWRKHIPGFVVGRPAYDNWLVDFAHHKAGLDVIDASKTIRAIHQTGKDGNFAGHSPKMDKGHNTGSTNPATGKKVGPHEWNHGTTTHAHFVTERMNGRVAIKARNQKSAKRSPPPLLDSIDRRR